FVMIDPTVYWPRLLAAIERPDLAKDPRFEEPFTRAANGAALVAIVEEVIASRTLDEWRPRLDAAGLIWSPVNRIEEVLDDRQVRAMGYVAELEHPRAGRFESLAPPFTIDGVALGSGRACSDCDADGDAVLREAGVDEGVIAKLRMR